MDWRKPIITKYVTNLSIQSIKIIIAYLKDPNKLHVTKNNTGVTTISQDIKSDAVRYLIMSDVTEIPIQIIEIINEYQEKIYGSTWIIGRKYPGKSALLSEMLKNYTL